MHLLPILIILLLLFIVMVSCQPSEFTIARSATINAPAATVFEQVNNLRKWNDWSPWAKLDPECKREYEGPEAGTDAIFRWAGNNKVGSGSMIITGSRPAEMVRFRLEFLKPFRATNTAEFTFQPSGNMTTVTWSMSGTNNIIGKIMGIFMNCDKMVGSQFEKGLANLKALVEK